VNDLNEQDIEVFVNAIKQYFQQTTWEVANIKAEYLIESKPPIHDFNRLIKIGGDYAGCIYFSAPRLMMQHLLTKMYENNQSDENLLDAVGEIANTISRNARQHFGEDMEISVPETMLGKTNNLKQQTRDRPYAVDIIWEKYTAALVIDFSRLH